MAQDQLPLYYKNSKVVGPGSTKTKWSEYYLLVVTLFGFLMLFGGILWFLPSLGEDHYGQVYSSFAGTSTTFGSSETESVVSSNGRVLPPTPHPHPNIQMNRTGNHSIEEQHMRKDSREVVPEPVRSSESVSGSKTSDRPNGALPNSVTLNSEKTRENTMRREKVVQVISRVFIVVSCLLLLQQLMWYWYCCTN